jgi:hypothetical protein
VVEAKTRRRRLRATKATSYTIADLVHADPDKALVMTCFGQLVADGHAQWAMLGDGEVQLSFHTGETFLLAARVIIRLA